MIYRSVITALLTVITLSADGPFRERRLNRFRGWTTVAVFAHSYGGAATVRYYSPAWGIKLRVTPRLADPSFPNDITHFIRQTGRRHVLIYSSDCVMYNALEQHECMREFKYIFLDIPLIADSWDTNFPLHITIVE